MANATNAMSESGAPITARISTTQVRPLRLEVLRPGMPPETVIFAGDDDPTTTHWGAFAAGRSVTSESLPLAIATLVRAPQPGTTLPAWQLRGMASAPQVRGQGYGAAVLRAVIAYVKRQEAGALLWCNARVSAVGFYRAHGFEIEGDEFEIAGVGPHFVMISQTL